MMQDFCTVLTGYVQQWALFTGWISRAANVVSQIYQGIIEVPRSHFIYHDAYSLNNGFLPPCLAAKIQTKYPSHYSHDIAINYC